MQCGLLHSRLEFAFSVWNTKLVPSLCVRRVRQGKITLTMDESFGVLESFLADGAQYNVVFFGARSNSLDPHTPFGFPF